MVVMVKGVTDDGPPCCLEAEAKVRGNEPKSIHVLNKLKRA